MRYLVIYNAATRFIPPAMYETTLEGALDFARHTRIHRMRAVDVSKTPGAIEGVEFFYDSMLMNASATFIVLEK